MARTVDPATSALVVGTTTISNGSNGKILYDNNGVLGEETANISSFVVGPASATDGVPALFDGTTGKLIKNSVPTGTGSVPVMQASPTLTGILTVPQIVNTPLVVTVSSNAATITRANRINNFTNSSASAMTITLSTSGALDGDWLEVRIYDASAATKGITWVNTENSTATAPTTSNGSTTLPLSVLFQYNGATSLWRCIASA